MSRIIKAPRDPRNQPYFQDAAPTSRAAASPQLMILPTAASALAAAGTITSDVPRVTQYSQRGVVSYE
jgi:hypothetical protein